MNKKVLTSALLGVGIIVGQAVAAPMYNPFDNSPIKKKEESSSPAPVEQSQPDVSSNTTANNNQGQVAKQPTQQPAKPQQPKSSASGGYFNKPNNTGNSQANSKPAQNNQQSQMPTLPPIPKFEDSQNSVYIPQTPAGSGANTKPSPQELQEMKAHLSMLYSQNKLIQSLSGLNLSQCSGHAHAARMVLQARYNGESVEPVMEFVALTGLVSPQGMPDDKLMQSVVTAYTKPVVPTAERANQFKEIMNEAEDICRGK